MKGWLLDTNVVFEMTWRAGDPRVLRWISGRLENQLFISVLTLGEYDKGIHNLPPGSRLRVRIEADLILLEQRFAKRTLFVTETIVRRWGRLSGDILCMRGRVPEVVDSLLAASAIEHGLVLATRNVKDVRERGSSIHGADDPAASG